MLRYSHVMVDAKSLWTAYRQVVNGEVLAFDKVEVANFIGYTSNEIERLPRVAERLETFLTAPASTKPRRYALLADQFVQPFPDQTDGEFKAMRDDLEQAVELITKRGGTVLRSREDVERFADEIDAKLPRAAS